MAGIAEIPGIDAATQELFRAAGIDSSATLMGVELGSLMATLGKVNGERQLLPELPAESVVASWQSAARIFEGAARGTDREVQISPQVMASTHVGGLPVAKLVPSKQLREAGVPASAVPVGRLVEQVAGGLRLAPRGGGQTESRPRPEETSRATPEASQAPQAQLGRPVRHLKSTAANDEESSAMEFREITEERKAQVGLERRNHGMSHKEPVRVYIGALATLLSQFLISVGFVAIAVTLTKAWYFQEPIPVREAVLLGVFPVALFIYVAAAMRVRCRLCGQRLFLPRQCRKHQRAHRSIFGPLFALASHIVFHGWFRCMLCGTKQRLKE